MAGQVRPGWKTGKRELWIDSSINFGDLCYNAPVDVRKTKGSVMVIYMIVVL